MVSEISCTQPKTYYLWYRFGVSSRDCIHERLDLDHPFGHVVEHWHFATRELYGCSVKWRFKSDKTFRLQCYIWSWFDLCACGTQWWPKLMVRAVILKYLSTNNIYVSCMNISCLRFFQLNRSSELIARWVEYKSGGDNRVPRRKYMKHRRVQFPDIPRLPGCDARYQPVYSHSSGGCGFALTPYPSKCGYIEIFVPKYSFLKAFITGDQSVLPFSAPLWNPPFQCPAIVNERCSETGTIWINVIHPFLPI
jgi:hypothetical protein